MSHTKQIPPPDHELGYTKPLVDSILVDRQCMPENFWEWMRGQTTTTTTDGIPIVYKDDLFNYLSNDRSNAPVTD